MLICRQYSTSLERRGIWEAFHHWLETRDFLKSEFKTRKKNSTHISTHDGSVCLQVPRGEQLTGSRRRRKRVTSPSPSMTRSGPCSGNWWVCFFVCSDQEAFSSLISSSWWRMFLWQAGVRQAFMCDWRERQKREGSRERKERGRKRETRWKGCPCWTETDVGDWWGSEQHWHTNCAATYNIIPPKLFCSHGLDNMCWCRTTAVQHQYVFIWKCKNYYNNFSLSICPITHNQGGKKSVL